MRRGDRIKDRVLYLFLQGVVNGFLPFAFSSFCCPPASPRWTATSKDDLSQPCLEYFELCLRGAVPALVNDGVAEALAVAAAAAGQGWAARVVGGSRPLRPPCVVWPVIQCTLSAGCAAAAKSV